MSEFHMWAGQLMNQVGTKGGLEGSPGLSDLAGNDFTIHPRR